MEPLDIANFYRQMDETGRAHAPACICAVAVPATWYEGLTLCVYTYVCDIVRLAAITCRVAGVLLLAPLPNTVLLRDESMCMSWLASRAVHALHGLWSVPARSLACLKKQ